MSIPQVTLSSGNAKTMPVLGLGTAADPFPGPEIVVKAVLDAIELGYRMFDTASVYQTEEALGEAVSQALSLGFIKSRDTKFLSPLRSSDLGGPGASWGSKGVLEYKVLIEIAKSKGKSVAQVALRWVYEQGVIIVMKSFNKERLKQNLEIFDWELSNEESKKIADIPQSRSGLAMRLVSETGPIKSLEELWDGEL